MEKTFIMVWIEEEEKWYYFKEMFDEKQFNDGYVDYYVTIDKNGLIINDTWNFSNVGKNFENCYCKELWL